MSEGVLITCIGLCISLWMGGLVANMLSKEISKHMIILLASLQLFMSVIVDFKHFISTYVPYYLHNFSLHLVILYYLEMPIYVSWVY